MTANDGSYAAAVLGSAPSDYFRMRESGVTQPVNEVNGGTGQYSEVTLGVDGGPFGNEVDVVSLWFRTTTSGVPVNHC